MENLKFCTFLIFFAKPGSDQNKVTKPVLIRETAGMEGFHSFTY